MTRVDRVLELVNESGLTAKEFAINAGIAGGSITDWKTGRSKPSVESLQKIAKYANVQLEWLTGDSNYKTKKDEMKEYLHLYNKSFFFKTIFNNRKLFDETPITVDDLQALADIISKCALEGEERDSSNVIPKYMISYILKGKNKEEQLKIEKLLTKFINECTNDIYEEIRMAKNNPYKSNLYMAPVYGQISAGIPNWAEECIESYLPIDPALFNIVNPEECFFLRVNGESMNKLIRNGAYALIRKQDIVENGEIAAVLVNGYDATLKKFSKQGDLVVLEPMSDDSSFQVQVYDKNTPIQILGKYIGKFEMK